jgi:phosphoglycerate dehydrogenase-like enzyme
MVKLKVLDVSSMSDELFFSLFEGHLDGGRFELVRAGVRAPEDRVCELVRDADILLTDPFHFTHVTRRIIEAGARLRLIQCYTIGFDDVDLVAARERGIPVANSAGITAKPMAEYAIMAALYLTKSIDYANSETHQGNWVQQSLVGPPRIPLEFGSLTLGILGCGSIGQETARLAGAFGARLLYHNRRRLPPETEESLGLKYVSFDGLLGSSDVLSVNVPLTDETRGMVGAEEIAKMKRGSVLINTARGEVVDVSALADALKSGHLRGAAVDVFVDEPNIGGCPLLGLRNVILTPHSSALSPDVMRRVPPKVMENLNRVYEGKPPLRVVN